MEQLHIRFHNSDFTETLPGEGYHTCLIHSARPRVSERGNSTLQVVYQLDDADAACDRITEYFVVAGASPQALRIGRRRLLALCRACGLDPREGDELELPSLVGRELQIRIGHDSYDGKPCARVLGYRSL